MTYYEVILHPFNGIFPATTINIHTYVWMLAKNNSVLQDRHIKSIYPLLNTVYFLQQCTSLFRKEVKKYKFFQEINEILLIFRNRRKKDLFDRRNSSKILNF